MRLIVRDHDHMPDPESDCRGCRPTRRERKIERMRTQVMGNAKRSTYRVSGRPDLARPGIWQKAQREVQR